MDITNQEIMHILKKWLLEKNISQEKFARTIGMSLRYIHGIVKGETIPSRQSALKIEEATNGEITAIELMFPEKCTIGFADPLADQHDGLQTVDKANQNTRHE